MAIASASVFVAISVAGRYLWLVDFRRDDLDLLWKRSR